MSSALVLPVGTELERMGLRRFLAKCEEATACLEEAWEDRELLTINELINWSEMALIRCRQCTATRQAKRVAARLNLHAERRAGQVLKKMPKNRGGGDQKSDHRAHREPGDPLTFKALDIQRLDAQRWQRLAAIESDDVYEEILDEVEGRDELTTAGVLRAMKVLRQEETQVRREEKQRPLPPLPENIHLHHGRFQEVMPTFPENSVDLILTDPPYGTDYFLTYAEFSTHAERVLKPGGSALVMIGQSSLPLALKALCTSLTYHWTLAWLLPKGASATSLPPMKVFSRWKPIVWLCKGRKPSIEFMNLDAEVGGEYEDLVESPLLDRSKDLHRWQQGLTGFDWLVGRFTNNDQIVCDPFMGSGTTGVACLSWGRRFLGIESDKDAFERADRRIREISLASIRMSG